MKRLLLSLLALNACFAAGPVGDWKGTLKAYADLRLVLHVQQTDAGAYKATLDSIDQGANGIPITSATFEGKRLKLVLERISARYEGDLSEDGKTLTGTWSQGEGSSPLTFYIAGTEPKVEQAPEQSASVAPLLGVWEGSLDTGSNKLRLRFTLTKDEKGQIKGGFDSLDQGASNIPMSGLSLTGSKFHFDIRGVAGSYDGDVSEDKKTIKGTWKQGGAELPLEWAQSSSGASKR
jgi:uncharacterized protein